MNQREQHTPKSGRNTPKPAPPAKHPLNTKLPAINAAILALYALSAALIAWIAKPDYGLVYPILFLAGICAIYSTVTVAFVMQRREGGRLVTIACWMNLLPPLLIGLFCLVQTFAMSIFAFIWDALGDHAMLIIFGLTLLTAILAVVTSFVLFGIGFLTARRANGGPRLSREMIP